MMTRRTPYTAPPYSASATARGWPPEDAAEDPAAVHDTPSRPRRGRRGLIVALAAATALSGCITTAYSPPVAEVPPGFAEAAPPAVAAAPDWWLAFRDPRLDALIAAGAAQNLDLLQAIERIEEARAVARATGADSFPAVTATGGATRGDETGAGTSSATYLGGNVSWVIDIFGGQRAARAAALAQLDAARLSVDAARLAFLGELTLAYIDLRFFQESMALTREGLNSRNQTLGLTQSMFDIGASNRLDVVQAEQLVASAEAELPALEVSYYQSLNRIASLIARPSAELRAQLQSGARQPRAGFRPSVGVPADLLRRRPDVLIAERQIAAAAAEAGVAEAALWPSLSLGGTITAANLSSGASGSLKTWSFGPQLSLPILDGGRNRANLEAARSRLAQSRLAYEAQVDVAVEEVENALSAFNRDQRAINAQQRLVSSSNEALDLARSSFELGGGQFLAVLDAERSLLDARRALAQAIRQQAANYVTLNLATGGGVVAPTPVATAQTN